jgi:preprotein translocase subunit Sss1
MKKERIKELIRELLIVLFAVILMGFVGYIVIKGVLQDINLENITEAI